MNKVFVFNLALNGLGVARALGNNGIEVVGLDSKHLIGARLSKHVKEFHRVTNPQVSEKDFIRDLIKLGKKEKVKPLLIPTNDVWAIAVSKHKKMLEEYFITYSPDFSIIDKIINKKEFYKIMKQNGFIVPETYNVKSFEELESLKSRFKYPLVLKPNDRMNTDRPSSVTKIYQNFRLRTIESFSEFEAYKNIISNYDFILQQKIVGLSNNMFTIGVYADENSDVIATFSGRKVRGYPIEHGDCYAGESFWVDELVDTATKIIKLIKFTGIAEVEFKKNDADGEYYLIEINPRTWSWIGITPHTGVNLPLIAYEHMINNQKKITEMDKEKKVLWTRMIDDKDNCRINYSKVKNEDFPKSIKEFEDSLNKYDEVVIAEKTQDDIWTYYAYYAIRVAVKLKSTINRVLKNR